MNKLSILGYRPFPDTEGRLSAYGYRLFSGILMVQLLFGFLLSSVVLPMAISVATIIAIVAVKGIGTAEQAQATSSTVSVVIAILVFWLILLWLSVVNVSLMVRRMHDFGHSGWWLLIALPVLFVLDYVFARELVKLGLPLFDGLVFYAFLTLLYLYPGHEEENRFGVPPSPDDYAPTRPVRIASIVVVLVAVLMMFGNPVMKKWLGSVVSKEQLQNMVPSPDAVSKPF